jgi:hypothetical protein
MMRTFLKTLAALLLLILVTAFFFVRSNMRDRHPGYKADLFIKGVASSALQAGFSAMKITPEVPDRWADNDGNSQYEPKKGDTFTDGNGNGIFDPVWIAGFSNSRAANGIHDDLWVRTMVIGNAETRIAVVALDAIGFMNDDIIDIRKRISSEAGVTYCIVASTHDHEAPDLLGLWGKTPFKSGINRKYMEFVKDQAARSVIEAVKNMHPARLEVSQDLTGAAPLVKDTRNPQVKDDGLRIIKAVRKDNGEVLGTLLAWADHAETLWSANLLITSDFVHYFREYVEKGINAGDTIIMAGAGGTAVYVNGAVGGLMTTHPSLTVTDPVTGEEYKEPFFMKADAEGKQLAMLALDAMKKPELTIDSAAISLVVRTIPLSIDNTLFKLGTAAGVLDRGTTGWMKMRSELSVFSIGPISFATIPGEAYPELVNGGAENPEGGDFGIQPVEVPPVRDLMPGTVKFVFCLANDEIGYILPKSQWDEKAPFTYGRTDSPYGEENSLGPETGPVIHAGISEMLDRLKAKN